MNGIQSNYARDPAELWFDAMKWEWRRRCEGRGTVRAA
jgi:hypothetical protein